MCVCVEGSSGCLIRESSGSICQSHSVCQSSLTFGRLFWEERRALSYTLNYKPRWANHMPTLPPRFSQSSKGMPGMNVTTQSTVCAKTKQQINKHRVTGNWCVPKGFWVRCCQDGPQHEVKVVAQVIWSWGTGRVFVKWKWRWSKYSRGWGRWGGGRGF